MTSEPRWFKSSYSNNGGDCVEVAADVAVSEGVVPMRDSKVVDGPVLAWPVAVFASFVAGVRDEGFGTV
ncbi:DUF397 domain-containing protein [Streptomyces sp. NPDC002454]